MTTELKRDKSANRKDNIVENPISLAKIQSQEQGKFKKKNRGDYFLSSLVSYFLVYLI